MTRSINGALPCPASERWTRTARRHRVRTHVVALAAVAAARATARKTRDRENSITEYRRDIRHERVPLFSLSARAIPRDYRVNDSSLADFSCLRLARFSFHGDVVYFNALKLSDNACSCYIAICLLLILSPRVCLPTIPRLMWTHYINVYPRQM